MSVAVQSKCICQAAGVSNICQHLLTCKLNINIDSMEMTIITTIYDKWYTCNELLKHLPDIIYTLIAMRKYQLDKQQEVPT